MLGHGRRACGDQYQYQGPDMQQTNSSRARRPLALAVSLALGIGSAQAATITVTTLGDSASGSSCTLRQAIVSANTNAASGACVIGAIGADTINFDAALANATITLANGELEVDESLVINGSGQTIDANQASRVLAVYNTATLTASSLTLTNGYANSDGGGIYLDYDTSLSLADVTVSNNSASDAGGGIYGRGYNSVILTDSNISGNTSNSVGGGLALGYGSLTLTGSAVSGNATNFVGGGLALFSSSSTLTGSTISGNLVTFGGGGGIYLYGGNVSIANDTVSGNTAYNYTGGGIAAKYADVDIATSTISGNSAGRYGGGIYLAGQGRGGDGTLAVTDSTISGNLAEAGAGVALATFYYQTAAGATQMLYGGTVSARFVNSTVTGNNASDGAGGFDVYIKSPPGSGSTSGLTVTMTTSSAQLDFVNSTISGNQGTGGSYGAGAISTYVDTDATQGAVTITAGNSIISGNPGTNGDVYLGAQASLTVQNSLLASALQTTYAGNGNVFSDAPGLAALANNNGPTQTMALLAGSPAIDAGNNALISTSITTDQRGAGYERIVNGTVDIGAFEFGAGAAPPPVAGTGVPVPVREPWALGLLGLLLGFFGLRTRYRRT